MLFIDKKVRNDQWYVWQRKDEQRVKDERNTELKVRKEKKKEIIKRTENFKEFKKEEEWRKTNQSVNPNEKFLTKKKQQ